MDDPAAFGGLVDAMVSGLVGATEHGRETVRREVPVGNGRAVDVVVVDDTAGTTARARYLLADGRMYAVVTTGLDEGAKDLDEVHARMLASFDTDRLSLSGRAGALVPAGSAARRPTPGW